MSKLESTEENQNHRCQFEHEDFLEGGFRCDGTNQCWMTDAIKYDDKYLCVFHMPKEQVDTSDAELQASTLQSLVHGWNKGDEWEAAFTMPSMQCGKVGFDGVTVKSEINFGDATFSGTVSFTNTTFNGDVNFQNTTFSRSANFTDATFSEEAQFGEATFSNSADFTDATFSLAKFKEATFGDLAYFIEATFSKEAQFGEATFSRLADFRKATFSRVADFRKATFSNNVWFDNATFSGEAWFEKTTFSSGADFIEATFSEEVWFQNATFNDVAQFREATFSGHAWFHETTFSDVVRFEEAIFSGEADFMEATFSDQAWFHKVIFTFGPDMGKCTFKVAPGFFDVSLTQSADFRGTSFWDTHSRDAAPAYRALKVAMNKASNKRQEAVFYGLEQQSLRNQDDTARFLKFFSFLYEKFSDYGQSLVRPVVSLTIVLVVFAAIYSSIIFEVFKIFDYFNRGAPDFWKKLLSITKFTVTNVTSPFRVWTEGHVKSVFGSELVASQELLISIIASFQTVLSLALITLFLLALRRAFKLS